MTIKRNWRIHFWYTLDIETMPIVKGLTKNAKAYAVGIHKIGSTGRQGTHKQFLGWKCLDEMFNFFKELTLQVKKNKTKKGIVFFIHNIKYDLSFIQPFLLKQKELEPLHKDKKYITIKNENNFQVLGHKNTKTYRFCFILNGVRVEFRDSLKLFNCNLKGVVDLIDDETKKNNPRLQVKGDFNYGAIATYEKGKKEETFQKILKSPYWLNIEYDMKRKYPSFSLKKDLILFNDEKELKELIGLGKDFTNTHKDKTKHLNDYLFKDCYILSEAIVSFYNILATLLVKNGVSKKGLKSLFSSLTIGALSKYCVIKMGDLFFKRRFPNKFKSKKVSVYQAMFEGMKKWTEPKLEENIDLSKPEPKKIYKHENIKSVETWMREWNGYGGGYTNLKKGYRGISELKDNKIIVKRKSKHFKFNPLKMLNDINKQKNIIAKINNNQMKLDIFKGVGGSFDLISSYPSKLMTKLMPMSKKYTLKEAMILLKDNKYTKLQKWVFVNIFELKKITKKIPAFFQRKKDFLSSGWKELDKSNDSEHFLSHSKNENGGKLAIPDDYFQFIKKHYDLKYEMIEEYFYHLTDYFQEPVKVLYELKKQASIDKNVGKKFVFKLLLNNIYGKTVENPVRQNTHYISWEEAKIMYKKDPFIFEWTYGLNARQEIKKMIYCDEMLKGEIPKVFENSADNLFLNGAYFQWIMVSTTKEYENYLLLNGTVNKKLSPIQVGSYITCLSKIELLNVINLNYDIWLYCDTDSVYVSDISKIKGIKLNPTEPLHWNFESFIKEFKALKPKCYAYLTYYGYIDFKIAGYDQGNKQNKLKNIGELELGFKYTQLEPKITNEGTTLALKEKYIR